MRGGANHPATVEICKYNRAVRAGLKKPKARAASSGEVSLVSFVHLFPCNTLHHTTSVLLRKIIHSFWMRSGSRRNATGRIEKVLDEIDAKWCESPQVCRLHHRSTPEPLKLAMPVNTS